MSLKVCLVHFIDTKSPKISFKSLNAFTSILELKKLVDSILSNDFLHSTS